LTPERPAQDGGHRVRITDAGQRAPAGPGTPRTPLADGPSAEKPDPAGGPVGIIA